MPDAWQVGSVAGAGVVGETYVFITSYRKARELIEEGEIGRPLQIRQRHGAARRTPQAMGGA